jgi:hypothetical protein
VMDKLEMSYRTSLQGPARQISMSKIVSRIV